APNASASSAENAVAKAQQDAADALAAANRTGYKASADKGWCDTGTGTVCAASTNVAATSPAPGSPGTRNCSDNSWGQYACTMTASLNPDWNSALLRTFGAACMNADFANTDCQPSMFMQAAVIAGANAKVDPRLVLSIALMETSGKEVPYVKKYGLDGYLVYEKAAVEASELGLWPGHGGDGTASIGITNIKPVTWTYLTKAYPQVFAGHQWSDLAGNTDLDLQATAYYVKYLEDNEVVNATGSAQRNLKPQEIIYGLYNGGIDPSSKSYPVYKIADRFGPGVSGNINAWQQYWTQANTLICGSGILTCSFQ
ncbi:hypothetical protein, partial [Kitasatospora nipponensis]|uniref:hypothetical protein n=1 Tax=Kitasatospora nipponensis TaxID=258049 RepID=UPI0031CF38E6